MQVYRREVYQDPADQLERQERAYYRDKLKCTACERRPLETGGDGRCKKPSGGCPGFSLDVAVAQERAARFGVDIQTEEAHRLLTAAGAGGTY